MTPDKQRIAIAQACGWKRADDGFWDSPSQKIGIAEHLLHTAIPDYLNDLNAMHEAVSNFDYDQADEFDDHLCDICKRSNDLADNPAPWRFAVTNASASQRAEAFLRTLNLWK